MNKSEILLSLQMLHSERRSKLPRHFVPKEEQDTEFPYNSDVNPLIDDLIEAVESAPTDKEAELCLSDGSNLTKMTSVLYASQFNECAFSISYESNFYSIEMPCRLLASCIDSSFDLGYFECDHLPIRADIKDGVTQQQLLMAAEKFADDVELGDPPKLYKDNTIGVLVDEDMEDVGVPVTYSYPEIFFSDYRLLQRAATKIKHDFFDEEMYEEYETMEAYLEESPLGSKFINTVINDSEGINFDEKAVFEAIAHAYQFRDVTQYIDGYHSIYDDMSYEEIGDRRDDEISSVYDDMFEVDNLMADVLWGNPKSSKDNDINYEENPNYGFASSDDLDDDEGMDDYGVIDQIVSLALQNQVDLGSFVGKINETKSNRPPSVLYSDCKYTVKLSQSLEAIQKQEDTEVSSFLFLLNETVKGLKTFDKDQSLVRMSEFVINSLEVSLKEYDKSYDEEDFKQSRKLYNSFRKNSQRVTKKNKNKGISGVDSGNSSNPDNSFDSPNLN